MELSAEQQEQLIIKLGVLGHLLKSAAQTMHDIVSIAEGTREKEIEELIANHTAQGMEMISKFLDEVS